jgi:hypothetical protein
VGVSFPTDTATLSGAFNPTGTIVFKLEDASNAVVYTQTDTVSGNGDYTASVGALVLGPGTYHWVANYSGDTYNPGTGDFTSDAEKVTITQASPSITTTAAGGGTVGSAFPTDTATLSGAFNPTGTIVFKLENASNAVVYTQTDTVSGNGDYTASVGALVLGPGTYHWVANYSGDTNNTGTGDFTSDEEKVTITKAGPSIVTTAAGGGTVGVSFPTDKATLSNGYQPTGTIVFKLEDASNAVVYTQTDTVSGNGDYTASVGALVLGPGTYHWVANYSGDTNNTGTGDFTSDEEKVTITKAGPSIITTASGGGTVGVSFPTDTATLSGAFNPTGTITFTLEDASNAVVYTQTDTVSGNGDYTAAVPNSQILGPGTYHWVANYSGDTNNTGTGDFTSAAENVTITQQAEISPTGTTAAQFAGGTAPTLDAINYSVKNNKITQGINPGVFFYFSFVTADPGQTIRVHETPPTNYPYTFQIAGTGSGNLSLYNATGTQVLAGGTPVGTTGDVTFNVTAAMVAANGGSHTFIVLVKYSTKNLSGDPSPASLGLSDGKPPHPAFLYTFSTIVNSVTQASATVNFKDPPKGSSTKGSASPSTSSSTQVTDALFSSPSPLSASSAGASGAAMATGAGTLQLGTVFNTLLAPSLSGGTTTAFSGSGNGTITSPPHEDPSFHEGALGWSGTASDWAYQPSDAVFADAKQMKLLKSLS